MSRTKEQHNTPPVRTLQNGEVITHKFYGKGKFVGYVGYEPSTRSARIQFKHETDGADEFTGEVMDFLPEKLFLRLKNDNK